MAQLVAAQMARLGRRGALASLVVDLLVVVVFVAIGRSTHRHGLSPSGMFQTFWPFAAGTVCGWCLAEVLRLRQSSLRTGLMVSVIAVTVGMTLRVLAGQGTAAAFIVVAIGFLAAAMTCWRLMFRAICRVRATPGTS